MKIKTVVRDNKRYHIINDSLIECNGSADCSHCLETERQGIEAWIELHNPICILCDEKPPCYICLREKCKDWWKDEAFNKEYGSYHGCRKMFQRAYCQEFACKYGFLGWWEEGWENRFNERSKTIEKDLLNKLRRSGEDNGKKDKARRKSSTKNTKPKQENPKRIPAKKKKPKRSCAIR